MIEARGLTKRYGSKTAVDDLTFSVQPGVVTGFLGPNGAGKSTTMRMAIGLDRPTKGKITVNGKAYRDFSAPLCEVGVLLEAKAVHTGRSAYKHLLAVAQTQGIPRRRVDEVLGLVGLSEVAGKRVGGFSLGMGQRLGIASAMLGDPDVLILDEPVNGLDPEGIRWIRTLLQTLAAEGRTIFVSSHLMSEMALTATHLIVVGRGKLIANMSVEEFIRSASGDLVHVRSPQATRLAEVLDRENGKTTPTGLDTLAVNGLTAQRIGDLAFEAGVPLHELTPRQVSLEDAFMDITRDSVEYNHGQPQQAHVPASATAADGSVDDGSVGAGATTARGQA